MSASPWSELALSEEHLARVQASGISPEVAKARGYRTVATPSDLEKLGFPAQQAKLVPALLVPIHGVDGGEPVGWQTRPDKPRRLKEREVKYETPKGQAARLDVPPMVREKLDDPNIPLWITEGARKADSAVSRGLVCVDLAGVWSWRGTNDLGGRLELADFDRIAFNKRAVYLVFDSDVMTKRQVRQALHRFSAALERRGAHVHIVVLPSGPKGEKRGLDDMLAAGSSPEDLTALVQDDFFSEDEKAGLDVQLRDFILNEYELGQDEEGNPYVVPRTGARIARMLHGGRPSLEVEAPYRFSEVAPTNPVVPLATIRNVMHHVAGLCGQGEAGELHLRAARLPSGIVLDLGDPEGHFVIVTAGRWAVKDRTSVLFRRTEAVRELPMPERGGSLEELRELLNVTDESWPLVQGWIIGALFENIARPWLCLTGPQGSGKSDAGLILASIFDPRDGLMSFPRKGDRSDLGATATSSYVLGFDNASAVNGELSDWLCSAVTGATDVRRVLYTSSTIQTLSYMRTGVLTGVTLGVIRPDLAERLVQLDFEMIPKAGRRDHEIIMDRFTELHPRILGAALDAVALALANLDRAREEGLPAPRMSDYARILRAYDLGAGTDLFGAYSRSVETALSDQVDDDPFLGVLSAWINEVGGIEGPTPDIFGKLSAYRASSVDLDRGDDDFWPRNERAFGHAVTRGEAALREVGITVERRKSHGTRLIGFKIIGGHSSETLSPDDHTLSPALSPDRSVIIAGQSVDVMQGDVAGAEGDNLSPTFSGNDSKIVNRSPKVVSNGGHIVPSVQTEGGGHMLSVIEGLPDDYGKTYHGGIHAPRHYSKRPDYRSAQWWQLEAFPQNEEEVS